jgi:hypothetical protein
LIPREAAIVGLDPANFKEEIHATVKYLKSTLSILIKTFTLLNEGQASYLSPFHPRQNQVKSNTIRSAMSMTTPRRDFLKSAFMSIAAAGIISHSAHSVFGQKNRLKDSQGNFQSPAQAAADPVFHFTRATFEPYLESDFRVTVGPYRTVNLTLVKVEDLRKRQTRQKGMPQTEGECFMLLFKASGELSDLQQTYVLQHEALGKFSLFLVEASEKGKAIYYSAIINHMRPVAGFTKM